MMKETTYIFDVHDVDSALPFMDDQSEKQDIDKMILRTLKMIGGYESLFLLPDEHHNVLKLVETYFGEYSPQMGLRLSVDSYEILCQIAMHMSFIFSNDLLPEFAMEKRVHEHNFNAATPFQFLVEVFGIKIDISESGTKVSKKVGTEVSDENATKMLEAAQGKVEECKEPQDSVVTDKVGTKVSVPFGKGNTSAFTAAQKENEFCDFTVNHSRISGLPSVEDMKAIAMNSYVRTLPDNDGAIYVRDSFTTDDFCKWVSEEIGVSFETLEEWRSPGAKRLRRRCSFVLCRLVDNEELIKLCRGRFRASTGDDGFEKAIVGYPEMGSFGFR